MDRILIRNGLVIDGSGAPGFVGDLLTAGGRIEQIGRNLDVKADKVIDAGGKVVIPGLIDPHVHEEYVCLLDGAMELFMRQALPPASAAIAATPFSTRRSMTPLTITGSTVCSATGSAKNTKSCSLIGKTSRGMPNTGTSRDAI